MPANVSSLFVVREPAWHGLGHIFDDYPGREEAMEKAGHNFRWIETPVSPLPITLDDGQLVAAGALNGFKALIRSDNGQAVAVVRDSYTPIDPEVLWDVTDTIIDQPNVEYVTAGVIGIGECMWVLAKLNTPVWISAYGRTDPSPVLPYLLVSNYSNGQGGFTGRTVLTRVVCANTQKAAENESDASGRVFTFRHTGDVMSRIEEAREVLTGVNADMAAQIADIQDLLGIRVDEKRRELFLKKFVPEPSAANVISDRVMSNIEEARGQIRAILNSKTCEGIEDTGYGLYQASVEYLDHVRRARSKESAFKRAILTPGPFKARAAEWIRELETV